MAIAWESIFAAMFLRRSADTQRFTRMIDVRDRCNGDIVIPLPDVEGEPTLEPPTPRLIMDAIDSTAMSAGGTMPSVICPPLNPAKSNGIKSMEFAEIRRNAIYANWHYNALPLMMLRYYRHVAGYGTGALIVLPDFKTKRATIQLRDPLTSYPDMRSPDDVREPINIGFVFGRSRSWLKKNYPANAQLQDWITRQNEVLWDVVEWIDENEIVIGVLGPRFTAAQPAFVSSNANNSYPAGIELTRWPNRAGMVPVAIPRRVTLDKIMGQVDTIIGSVDLLTRLAALEVVAAEKAVFPDMQVTGVQGRPPTLVGGTWRDGRTGDANVIIDGQASYLVSSVGPATFQTMANLERNIRLSSGNPGLGQGEFTGAIRSGQAANALAGFSINPRVQELHSIAERSLAIVDEAVLRTEKAYWPDKRYFVFDGNSSMVDYQPSKHFETFDTAAVFSFPGLDLSQVTVAVAQLNASGLMSRSTARQKHPLMKDAEMEEKKVLVERLDEAALAGILAQFQQGQMDPEFYILLREHLTKTGELGPAAKAAREEMAAQQAQQPAQPAQGLPPGAAPGAAPGGPEQTPSWAPQPGPANLPGVNQDQVKVYQLLRNLRSAPEASRATA